MSTPINSTGGSEDYQIGSLAHRYNSDQGIPGLKNSSPEAAPRRSIKSITSKALRTMSAQLEAAQQRREARRSLENAPPTPKSASPETPPRPKTSSPDALPSKNAEAEMSPQVRAAWAYLRRERPEPLCVVEGRPVYSVEELSLSDAETALFDQLAEITDTPVLGNLSRTIAKGIWNYTLGEILAIQRAFMTEEEDNQDILYEACTRVGATPETTERVIENILQRNMEEIAAEVQRFLHPYITGDITEQNEGAREGLYTQLEEKLGPNSMLMTVDPGLAKLVAIQAYIKSAALGLYVRMARVDEREGIARWTSDKKELSSNSKEVNQLVRALKPALRKDFPDVDFSNEDLVEIAMNAMIEVNLDRDISLEQAHDYERPAPPSLQRQAAVVATLLQKTLNSMIDMTENGSEFQAPFIEEDEEYESLEGKSSDFRALVEMIMRGDYSLDPQSILEAINDLKTQSEDSDDERF